MNITPIPAFSDNYIWMIVHEGRAAVVDPGDPAPVLKTLEEQGLITRYHHHHASSL